MRYTDFEYIMSSPRMNRYLGACNNDTRKAMTLYRKNLKLSQELFTVISCFEVALRNAIDRHYSNIYGNHWLRDFAMVGGVFDTQRTYNSQNAVNNTIAKLGPSYTHPRLVSELGFGFWRYLFGRHQYRLAGRTLHQIFTNLPPTTRLVQYNAATIFDKLERVNKIRNRIAHHDPICFRHGVNQINTNFPLSYYNTVIELFDWLDINASDLLYGLDKVNNVIDEINNL